MIKRTTPRRPPACAASRRLSISATASGENRNCPNDPAAVPTPKASERHCSRHQLAEGADHHRERRARKPEADEQAGGEMEHRGRGRIRHRGEAERVEHGADAQHRHRAEAVGDARRRRLRRRPTQHLDRERQREHVAAPAVRARHRGEEEPEARARTKPMTAMRQPQTRITSGRVPVSPTVMSVLMRHLTRSGRVGCAARDRLLDDRQIDQRRGTPKNTDSHQTIS